MSQKKINMMFVCMGNICRSPTAHAVMQSKVNQLGLELRVSIESSGTHAYHIGEQSDARSRQTAAARGIDMEFIRAQKIAATDFTHYDFIYAMDADNLALLEQAKPQQSTAQLELFLSAANRLGMTDRTIVPDPYYGGAAGFTDVFDLVSIGCDAILHELGLRELDSL